VYPDYLITAGMPRVGDSNYWKWFEKNILTRSTHYRVVNEKDPVPKVLIYSLIFTKLPPYILGFTQINREIWYTKGKYNICDTDLGEDRSCSWTVTMGTASDHYRCMGWDYNTLGCDLT
jgi:hypothetical protein